MKDKNGFFYGLNCENITPITLRPLKKISENALVLGQVGKSFTGLNTPFESEHAKVTDTKNEME